MTAADAAAKASESGNAPGSGASAGLLAVRCLQRATEGSPDSRECLGRGLVFLALLLLSEPVYCLASGYASFMAAWSLTTTVASLGWCGPQSADLAVWPATAVLAVIAGIAFDPVAGGIRRAYLRAHPEDAQCPGQAPGRRSTDGGAGARPNESAQEEP